MIKVSVFYRTDGGSRFDHEYFRKKHLPLIKNRLGDACVRFAIDKGIDGGVPGTSPLYVASCHIYCKSAEAFSAAFEPHSREIVADVTNYTDIVPTLQISEVVEV